MRTRGPIKYRNPRQIVYWSPRYKKFVIVPQDYPSDGATGARDIVDSISWWVHDWICDNMTWADGTRIRFWQASRVLSDILWSEGRWFRAVGWFWATLILGPKF